MKNQSIRSLVLVRKKKVALIESTLFSLSLSMTADPAFSGTGEGGVTSPRNHISGCLYDSQNGCQGTDTIGSTCT